MISPNLPWQVQVNEKIYDANFDELCQWILEGAVLRHDKVRRGNLRWLEAEKVPELCGFFNLAPIEGTEPNVTLTNGETQIIENQSGNFVAMPTASQANAGEISKAGKMSVFCSVHIETASHYACDTCGNSFCKNCPKTFGSVKICPVCGAMCRLFYETDENTKTVGAVFRPYAAVGSDDEFQNPQLLLKQLGFAATLKSLGYQAKLLSKRSGEILRRPSGSLKSLKGIFRRRRKIEKLLRYFDPNK